MYATLFKETISPMKGDDSFLAGPTERTTKLWDQVMKLYEEEREKGGMLDADTSVATHITAHAPGYIDKDLETIVGLQTDKTAKTRYVPLWWLAHCEIRY